MADVSYRKATAKDFPRIATLLRTTVDDLLKRRGFFETSAFASSRLPPVPQQGFPWFEMGLQEDSEGFWVAEARDEIIGITLSWVRGSLWYLAHLFVSPNHQGLNIGQNLMDRAMQHGKNSSITNRALVTFAYNPVSISLYARNGIYPQEPLYYMECPRNEVKLEKTTRLEHERMVDFKASRERLSRIDMENTGYPRDRNHEFLFSLPTVQCHMFFIKDQPVGYAYVWKTGRVGPAAAVSHNVFIDTVRTAMGLAAEQESPNLGMLVTGSNEELMKTAFEQKMKILDTYLFMSSKPLPNFSNYLVYPTGAML